MGDVGTNTAVPPLPCAGHLGMAIGPNLQRQMSARGALHFECVTKAVTCKAPSMVRWKQAPPAPPMFLRAPCLPPSSLSPTLSQGEFHNHHKGFSSRNGQRFREVIFQFHAQNWFAQTRISSWLPKQKWAPLLPTKCTVSLPLPNEPGRKLAAKFSLGSDLRGQCLLTMPAEASGCTGAGAGKRQNQTAIAILYWTQKLLHSRILKTYLDDVQRLDCSCVLSYQYLYIFSEDIKTQEWLQWGRSGLPLSQFPVVSLCMLKKEQERGKDM